MNSIFLRSCIVPVIKHSSYSRYPIRYFATPASSAGRVTVARVRRPVKAAIEIVCNNYY